MDEDVTQINCNPVSAFINVQKLLFGFEPFFEVIEQRYGVTLS